jgi:hypothetical protein
MNNAGVTPTAAVPHINSNVSDISLNITNLKSRQQEISKCKTGFEDPASVWAIQQGISSLQKRDPNEDCNLGPGQCQILECSYNSAIQYVLPLAIPLPLQTYHQTYIQEIEGRERKEN